MKCSHCGHENRDGAKYCEECGQQLISPEEKKAEAYINACVWYYDKFGVHKGPFTQKELEQLYTGKMISQKTPVWKEGMEKWETFESFEKKQVQARKSLVPKKGWYIFLNQHTAGPYTDAQIIDFIADGTLKMDDLIKGEDNKTFLPLSETKFKSEPKPEQPALHEEKETEILWYYKAAGKEVQAGFEELKEMVANGKLSPGSLVYQTGWPDWKKVRETPLKEYLPLEVNMPGRLSEGWYIEQDKETIGPLETDQVAEGLKSGEFKPQGNIFYTGWKEWIPLVKSRFLIYTPVYSDGLFVLENEKVSGPYTKDQVKDWLNQGVLASGARIWQKGRPGWQDLESIHSDLFQEKKSAFSSFRNRLQDKSRKPDSQEESWYIGVDGKSQGPYTSANLQQFYAQNIIDDDTYVWKKGMPEWILFQDSKLYKAKMQDSQWYYVNNGRSKGPFTYKEMQKLYYDGTIDCYTWVWKEGMDDWQAYQDSQLAY